MCLEQHAVSSQLLLTCPEYVGPTGMVVKVVTEIAFGTFNTQAEEIAQPADVLRGVGFVQDPVFAKGLFGHAVARTRNLTRMHQLKGSGESPFRSPHGRTLVPAVFHFLWN